MGRVTGTARVPLDPADARELWLDTSRWPTFVDGFSHVVHTKGEWPQEGSRLTWQSTPRGRGSVLERVRVARADEVVTEVVEERLEGTQTATFAHVPGGCELVAELDYRLTKGNVLLDVLFVRRALRDALRRTLQRYAREAEAEAELAAQNGERSPDAS